MLYECLWLTDSQVVESQILWRVPPDLVHPTLFPILSQPSAAPMWVGPFPVETRAQGVVGTCPGTEIRMRPAMHSYLDESRDAWDSAWR